jgi:HK97 family phage portal protein
VAGIVTRVKQVIADALSGTQVLAGVMQRGEPPRPGTEQLLRMYGKSPWLRGVVNKVSRDTASVQWNLFVVRRGPGERAIRFRKAQYGTWKQRLAARKQAAQDMVLEEIGDNPLLDVLNDPNPHMTGHSARQVTQIWVDLKGEGYWLKERGSFDQVERLWPIPPHWIKRTATPARPFFEIQQGTFHQEVPMTEVMTFQDVNAVNPYARGTGTAEALADEIETDEYAAKHTKAWFYNRARPDLLVSGPNLSESEAKRLEEDWNNKHQGFWRAFKARFTNAELNVHELSQSFESMQLVDLRKHERDTIVQVFGVPPEILGILSQSNRATINAADFLYESHVIVPRLELMRDIFQEQLVVDFDERLIIDYENPVPEDLEHQLSVARAQPHMLKVNEWREMSGMEPLSVEEGGEMFMVPFNLMPVSGFRSVNGTSGGLGSQAPVVAPVEDEEENGNESPAELIGDEARSVVSSRRKAITEDQVQRMIEEAVRPETIRAATSVLLARIVEQRGNQALEFLGFQPNFDVQNPRVLTFLDQYSTNRIRDLINQTTRDQLRVSLVEGVGAGESIAQLSDRVSEVFSAAKGPRAETIARTEVIRASNWGQHEAWEQTGVIQQQEWISTPDERTRGNDPRDEFDHVNVDGQIRDLDAPFLVSGQMLRFPGDDSLNASAGNVINCRCTIAAVIEEDTSLLQTDDARVLYWKQFDSRARRDEREFRSSVIRAFQDQQNELNRLLRGG